jgi:hypothetical protein
VCKSPTGEHLGKYPMARRNLLPSQMTACPLYIASAQFTQNTQLPAVLLLLVEADIRADYIENMVPLLRVQSLGL